MGEEQLEFEEAVSRVEADQAAAEARLAEAGREREAAQEAMSEAEKELAKARAEAAKIVEDARKKAGVMLRDAQGTIDEIASEFGYDLLARIPIDPAAAASVDKGMVETVICEPMEMAAKSLASKCSK